MTQYANAFQILRARLDQIPNLSNFDIWLLKTFENFKKFNCLKKIVTVWRVTWILRNKFHGNRTVKHSTNLNILICFVHMYAYSTLAFIVVLYEVKKPFYSFYLWYINRWKKNVLSTRGKQKHVSNCLTLISEKFCCYLLTPLSISFNFEEQKPF